MRIKWLGHACFKITSSKGIRILTDPFDDNVGYPLPQVEADIVTISHNHYDHNFIDCVKGNFEVLNKVGNFYIKDINITGVHTYHDEEKGQKRGDNIVYVFDVDGIRVCHLGDLGHILTPAQVEMIGRVDVLLVPVGGTYTIDAEGAHAVVKLLNPKIVIPMHFKTDVLKFNLDSVEKFLDKYSNVERLRVPVLEVKNEDLNKDELKVVVLNYK
ncbi:L-ascorbate metabolism protein UlaG, beta-lactamase superfamily [Caloramator fervidus]|uniref:L-ascorbate metabolism protein UlaG, beta-lactamase superfamily n=1 Tax=Caloramator fervidus TaxID=29344 RepID=A0A1H5RM27_9CLOT|nr:MBL fold metallo-hydrolase [Caloramator fervidus]SEF38778.1 L-ascorbate metabolism protein UlaG, beta-lactamase superfamily [Caloramator fervidus]